MSPHKLNEDELVERLAVELLAEPRSETAIAYPVDDAVAGAVGA